MHNYKLCQVEYKLYNIRMANYSIYENIIFKNYISMYT